ncbi:hypothetical protein HYT18_01955 [Candidatus Microgenomates bacterium]|nr:hypothetical protein [Candidatus Microgenomates bacterium]
MNKKIITIIIIVFIVLGFLLFRFAPLGWKANLVSPASQSSATVSKAPTPIPTPNAPKTFQFDSATDLEAELEKVNPQVLDSDFE